MAAGPVLTAAEYMADPHLGARRYFCELTERDVEARQRYDGFPVRINGQCDQAGWRAAPLLGEHNAEVLDEVLGLSPDEVARLYAAGVLTDRPPSAR